MVRIKFQNSYALNTLIYFLFFMVFYIKYPPFLFQFVQPGLDPSWKAAIAYAINKGMVFGTDIVFSGGPLSGIYTREFEYKTAYLVGLLSLSIILYVSYSASFLIQYSRSLLISFCAIIIIYLNIGSYDTLLMCVPLFCFLQGATYNSNKRDEIVSSIGSTLSGIIVLAKFSIFPISIVAMLALDMMSIQRGKLPRHLLLFASGLCFGFVASGQQISHIFEFLISSMEFSSGYSSAMSLAVKVPELLFWLIFAGAYIILLSVDAYRNRHVTPAFVLLTRIVILICFLFIIFKAGFVRQDLHTTTAWSALSIAIMVTLRWLPNKRVMRSLLMAMAAICIVPPWILSYNIYQELPINSKTPQQLASAAQSAAQLLLDPVGWREKNEAENTAAMSALRSLVPYPTLKGAVDIIQSEQSEVIANGLDYRPRPSVQEYATYNPKLIARNRAFFEGPRAPDNLIIAPGSIDQRHPASVEGALWPLFFSRYEPESIFLDKLVLKRRATPLNNLISTATSVQAEIGQEVALPITSDPIMVSIQLTPTFFGKLLDLIYRPPMSEMSVTYEDGTTTTHRIVPDMASEGLLVSPLVDSVEKYILVSSGYMDQRILKSARRITVRVGDPAGVYRHKITVRFERINGDILRSAQTSELVRSIISRNDAFNNILRYNTPNGSTIAIISEGLLSHAPSTLALPAQGNSFLKLTFGIRNGAWSNGAHTNGACFILRSGQNVLMQKCLDPIRREMDRGEQSVSVALPSNVGDLTLETACNGDCNWDWTYWSGAELK